MYLQDRFGVPPSKSAPAVQQLSPASASTIGGNMAKVHGYKNHTAHAAQSAGNRMRQHLCHRLQDKAWANKTHITCPPQCSRRAASAMQTVTCA